MRTETLFELFFSVTMYLDSDTKLEALSSLFGQTIKPYKKKKKSLKKYLLSLRDFFIGAVIGTLRPYSEKFFIDEKEFFDPQYDYNFTNLYDSSTCMRGNELYVRPTGWYRMAMKVRGKYPDGDTWLGTDGWRSHSVAGEWPVSYHGTSLNGAKGIIRSHYKTGDRGDYGRGIYSTPIVEVAERENYAKTFTSAKTGRSYKVILQNRINPQMRQICRRSDYWLVPVQAGTSVEEERYIAETSLRPYGILIKELY